LAADYPYILNVVTLLDGITVTPHQISQVG
jgi:hypothetical protein